MQPRNGISNENEVNTTKTFNTALLLGAINILISPSFAISKSAGLVLMIAANVFSIYKFHELGKARRPFSNLLTSGLSMFAPMDKGGEIKTREIENAVKNVIEGGDATAREIATMASRIGSRPR